MIFSPSGLSAQQSRPSPASRPLERRILAILREKVAQQAFWGIEVVSLRDGRPIVRINPDKRFTPASTAKLFTVAAALVRLGPNSTYQTTVETAAPLTAEGRLQGDLVLVGRGDPNLSGRVLPYRDRTERTDFPAKVFEDLAEETVRSGVRMVEGDLVVDDSYFVLQPYGQGWGVDDLLWSYGAPVTALAFNDNAVSLRIRPGTRAGDPAWVRLESVEPYPIENRVVTVAPGQPAAGAADADRAGALAVERLPGSRTLQVWGQIPEGSPEQTRLVAVENPPQVAGELFLQELKRRGVELRGALRVREQYPSDVPDLRGAAAPPPPSATTVLASHQSLPLAESLKVILKVSQNLHAEMLLRTLGRERRNVGSAQAGWEEIQDFLKEIGIAEDDVLLRDGSGLSRQNLATPSAMVALLRHMYASPYRALWMDLLPIAGMDGTLTDRLQDKRFAGRVLAKTGSFNGAAALAGYARNRNNQWLAFAVFVNHHNLPASKAAALLDRMVEEIALSR